MEQYYIKEETPLKFHKFFWYVSLPLGFLVLIGSMISEIREIVFFSWLYAIDIGYYVIALTLMLVCFIGFFEWKSYAWYGVMIYLSVIVLYNLIGVIIYAVYLPDEIGTAIGQLLGILIYAILVGIYYKKRRPLFFTGMARTNVADNCNLTNAGRLNGIYLGVPPQANYCHKCGFELLEASDFCSKCGAPVIKG
ncbi:MAG: zinc-ribbon domain-containing protein [Bacillota bacterium]|jgi:hypothetical protein